VALVPRAAAHGYIVRAIPNDGSVLERAPSRVQYWFSEGLETNFSTLSVRAPNGEIVATSGVAAEDERLMSARLPSGLPNGAYIVELRLAFASDGHVITETQAFFVGETAATYTGAATANAAVPLEVVWRVFVLASLILLFGTYSLYALVLIPAWGSTTYQAGLLPPRVMGRLNVIVSLALGVAFAGNGLALLQQTMVFYGVNAGTALNSGFVQIVRSSTRFGDVWNARMAFLMLAALLHAASLYFRASQPQNVRAFWVANAWLMGMVLGTLSITSHAAGSLLWIWLAVSNDWLHTAAVGFWVGGLAALVLVLPAALQPYTGDARRQALLAALRRFSRIATVCVFLVIATGIYSALNWLYTPSDLTNTSYGNTLILKVFMVGLLVLLGAAHHITLHPARYQHWAWVAQRASSFMPTLRLEVLASVGVLCAVGLLSATPIPAPIFFDQQIETPRTTQTHGDLTITLTLSPGGPGINTYEILMLRDEQPINDLRVYLQLVNPSRDWRSAWHNAESVGDGLYISTGDELNAEGTWWMLLDVTDTAGIVSRFAVEWSISSDAAVPTSSAPQMVHVVSLLSIILVVGWAGSPFVRRAYHALDLRPTMLMIAFAATVAIIIFFVIGYFAIRDSQARFEARLNPPPNIINPVLPDADSLARGQTLYTAQCSAWRDHEGVQTLRRELPTLRDEALFNVMTNGWRSLPPCEGNLNATDQWNIVNYLRTWERDNR
jgi:copper transport protein